MDKKKTKDYLFSCRHTLHQIPEVGCDLPQTIAFVSAELDKMDIRYSVIKRAGIVATIGSGEKALLIREDMDALPIIENSGESFASTNGNMHACGHDMHTSMLLGAAMMLKEMENELGGQVILYFECDEECFGGAANLIRSGLLDDTNIKGAVALHSLPGKGMDPGTYTCKAGPANSSVAAFRIRVKGRTAHGAMQYRGRNPINAAVQIYNSISAIISNELDAREFAVASICSFNSGNMHAVNVIPALAELGGTIRTYDYRLNEYIQNRIKQVAEEVAAANRVECSVDIRGGIPACINEPAMSELVERCAEKCGMRNLRLAPQLTSDDFALFAAKYPGAYVWIGAGGEEQKYADGALHSPTVCMNDEALPYGAMLLKTIAIEFLS